MTKGVNFFYFKNWIFPYIENSPMYAGKPVKSVQFDIIIIQKVGQVVRYMDIVNSSSGLRLRLRL